MIAELGHFALVLALAVALVQATVPLYGAHRGSARLMDMAAPAALTQLLFVAVSFFALMHAFVVSDFSVSNVAENSHSLKPMLYKVTGVWGNHEGSMLLWVLILALFGGMIAMGGRRLPSTLAARTIGIQGLIGVAFLAYILLTSNPFLRLDPAPLDGRDLNPLLQDPGLAFHPPFLYLGYVGLSSVFSFAVAALLEGRVDPAWARWVRPWTLVAWAALTLGIVLGSWWAYYELGWGGWWFWDPVENASFMPWLVATALLHSAIVVEKRDALKIWTILLAILAFSLSLMGTFLVRSGVLTSVHAFATDPTRGVFILGLLVVAIGGALALFAWRAPQMASGAVFQPVSREGALILNNLFLSVACATVLLGTLFPLFAEAFEYKVSVGVPYYNLTFGPLMVPLLLAVPFGPMLAWKRGTLTGAFQRLVAAAVAAVAVTAVAAALSGGTPLLASFGMGLATWLVVGALCDLAERTRAFRAPVGDTWARARGLPGSVWGMALAHGGLGIFLAGVVAVESWKTEELVIMAPGDTVTVAGHTLRFDGVERVRGPNYMSVTGNLAVTDGRFAGKTLTPEKRFYPVQRMPTTEAAIVTGLLGDLYVVMGEVQENGSWSVRIFDNPLAPWLWGGAGLMVLGGCLSLADRRLRVGAPQPRARRKPAEAAA
ncbi:MAG: heme lyase CcmF/NrfE family subunit [Alphaproteobacteria bacterium]|nr:heme lyase CcmF/NrfE family subunit [Alphaproteobacteria bacterium]MDX5368784.1 heme lyase CcmF/NrfE family subunit [Alphaproteobacteria bacterium]MDX5463520.1 heme lyase CcmF/NrfE family subunit [Alphaproteobacteria bacterium]